VSLSYLEASWDPRRHPGSTQEAPRKHPRDIQEDPGGTQEAGYGVAICGGGPQWLRGTNFWGSWELCYHHQNPYSIKLFGELPYENPMKILRQVVGFRMGLWVGFGWKA